MPFTRQEIINTARSFTRYIGASDAGMSDEQVCAFAGFTLPHEMPTDGPLTGNAADHFIIDDPTERP